MWPTAPSFGTPFGDIACPGGAKCDIPYCLFSHDGVKLPQSDVTAVSNATAIDDGRTLKRLKLNDGQKQAVLQAATAPARTAQPAFTGSIASKEKSSPVNNETASNNSIRAQAIVPASNGNASLPRTATRQVSPPAKSTVAAPKPDSSVPLNPRKLGKEPASFTKRLTFLKALRAYFAALNEKISKNPDAEVMALKLTDSQLNKLAINEEEKIGIQHRAVYENVLKNRLVALKKMTVEDWVRERKDAAEMAKEALAKHQGQPTLKKPPPPIDTGLSAEGEVEFLSHFIADQSGLDAHGYVTKQPTQAELENTQQALAIAMGWELCDRCNTRFQVFPERRAEDGALTSGGNCSHHWGKKQFPKKAKGEPPGQTKYSCCGEVIGSPGCHVHNTHVFYIKDRKRLSTILPFKETPQNDSVEQHTAVCFDCEMGYTTNGLELMRLTAISWPSHEPLLDILVRPLGHILDLNTRFSGITPDQYFNAKPYDFENPKPTLKDLRIVDSPYVARDLLFSLISPSTPLIGHAIENDLNAVRIIHPNIVDTVLLYPHRAGLPIRNSLRNLASTYLQWDIQQAGAAGHDSFEDAKATGELVRFKLAQGVANYKSNEGWQVINGRICPPLPQGPPPSLIPVPPPLEVEPKTGWKRKHAPSDDGSGNEILGGREYDVDKPI